MNMKPYVLLIGDQNYIVNIVVNSLDNIIFNNPLLIKYPEAKQMRLDVPQWLRTTPDRDFHLKKDRITMILNPTENLKTSYIKIINDLQEQQIKAKSAEETEEVKETEKK